MNSARSVRATSLAVAGVAALAMLLAGCNSDSSDAGADPAPQTSQSTEAPASTGTASTPASSTSSSTADSGDSDGKPAKTEIVAGLSKFYQETQNLSKDLSKKFATCMVDQMYEKATAKTLSALKDGDPAKMDKADTELLTEAGFKCASIIE